MVRRKSRGVAVSACLSQAGRLAATVAVVRSKNCGLSPIEVLIEGAFSAGPGRRAACNVTPSRLNAAITWRKFGPERRGRIEGRIEQGTIPQLCTTLGTGKAVLAGDTGDADDVHLRYCRPPGCERWFGTAMNSPRPTTFAALAVIVITLLIGCSKQAAPASGSGAGPGKIKIGFLVKQPEEPWFQFEWKGADKAGRQYGFEVIKLGVPDGEKVIAAIDNLAALGAQGFVIC